MVTKEVVLEALKDCYDPEIPVNIVDLGLIYDVQVQGDTVNVEMTLTAPGCHMAAPISEEAKLRIEQLDGVKAANVKVVWEPPWTPERISPEAKKMLGFGE